MLPPRKTLVCHLLAAWTLKLALWASDLNTAATTGSLPFLRFAVLAEEALVDGTDLLPAGFEIVPGLVESPQLAAAPTLVMNAQAHAAEWQLVVPELNLSARHLCCHGRCC